MTDAAFRSRLLSLVPGLLRDLAPIDDGTVGTPWPHPAGQSRSFLDARAPAKLRWPLKWARLGCLRVQIPEIMIVMGVALNL